MNSAGHENNFEIDSFPEIEVMIPAILRDLDNLKICLRTIQDASVNRITRISIIVPESQVSVFEENLKTMNSSLLEIISETTVVDQHVIKRIRDFYGTRSGWVLAEFIKANYVLKSRAAGVLVVDADTVLTAKKLWLGKNFEQELFPVLEYHKHYFDFLDYLEIPMARRDTSFMSHYMLFQPRIYQEMFDRIKFFDLDQILTELLSFPSINPHSPVCFCYEAYSHYLLAKYPKFVKERKWANIQIAREEFLENEDYYLKYAKKHFCSISSHAYL